MILWPITPGAYLKARRLVAGMTIAEVAAWLRTEPHLHEVDLIDWIKRIEADAVPASAEMIVALRAIFRFDPDILPLLGAVARGELPVGAAPRLCGLCGSQPGDIIPAHMTWTDPVKCPVCTTFGPVPDQDAA